MIFIKFKTFENNMDEHVFLEILQNHFLPKSNELYGNDYFLHKENDPKQCSGLIASYVINRS